jgi:DNA-binding NarL/FixJ family response regulator
MKRLLLVDDHDLFRQVLAVILEQHTDLKENLQAGSLAEAHQILDELEREEEVDLAVVDLDLPEGDATQLIEDLRELEVPVLALTSSMSLERRTSALRAGAGEVLTTAACGEKIVGTAKRLLDG